MDRRRFLGMASAALMTAPVVALAERRSFVPVSTTVPRVLTRTLSAAVPLCTCLITLTTLRVGVSGPTVVGGAGVVTGLATVRVTGFDVVV